MTLETITQVGIETALRHKVEQIRQKPAYRWADNRRSQKAGADGEVAIKAAVANCAMDFDLWKGLRNPALVGRHPAGLREIWEMYAANDIRKTRPDGTPNYLSMPIPFEEAAAQFGRAVIISTMLPVADEVFERYAETIVRRNPAPDEAYCKVWSETANLLDEAVGKMAMELNKPERTVVPLTTRMVDAVSEQTIPPIHRGNYHGPCKGGNFPHKSVAVLTGLGQFGVSRAVLRDEVSNGSTERFIGQIRSIVLFDAEDPVTDGSGGVVHLTDAWREQMMALSDFTNVRPEVNRQRYCTYVPDSELGEEGCGLCVQHCPSGAIGSSAPKDDGAYAEAVRRDVSRFSDGHLQFNFARCLEERTQKANLYPDYMCARCVVMCAARGKRRGALLND